MRNLGENEFFSEGVFAIVSVLKELKALTDLNISIYFYCVTNLYIGYTNLGNEGAIVLSPAIKEVKSLSALFIGMHNLMNK